MNDTPEIRLDLKCLLISLRKVSVKKIDNNVMKLFNVAYKWTKQARVFVPGKAFRISLIFASKARRPRAHERCFMRHQGRL